MRPEENIAAVSTSVSDDREMSICRRSQQIGPMLLHYMEKFAKGFNPRTRTYFETLVHAHGASPDPYTFTCICMGI